MFTPSVNTVCKQIVENKGMHETAQRLYEAASLLSGGLVRQQGEVAAFFGVSPQVLKNWEGRGISQQGMVSICEARPISLSWLNKGEGPMTPGQHPAPRPAPVAIDLDNNPDWPAVRRVSVKAQAGITGYAVEAVDDLPPIVFRADWYKAHGYKPERLLALRVRGESMVPSLWPGDLIVVNTENTTPKDGVAALVAYYGEVTVKRLQMDAGQWWLTSDNPDQRRHARKLCDDSTVLIGEVIYKQSERV